MLMITSSQHQMTLDGSITHQPRVPPFSSQGLIDHLVELIVSKDEAFYFVDKPAFCRLLYYLHPSLKDKEIPHCTKIREEVMTCATQGEYNVKEALQVCSTLVRHVESLEC